VGIGIKKQAQLAQQKGKYMKLTVKINPGESTITLNDRVIRWDEFEGDWRIDNKDATYSFNHLQDAYDFVAESMGAYERRIQLCNS